MQSSLKKSLYLGLAALSFVSVAAVSTTASAKSYAKAGAYSVLKADATKRNVEATGTNALYTKPGTVKGAKVVASKATMAKLASSKKSADYFRAYGQKTTNRGSVYYRVVTMDGKYRGYVYGGKTADTFAGGVKSAETTTTATTPTKTTGYYLKDVSKNTIWTAPKYTQYKASKVNLYGATSKDAFKVDSALTKTREGSLYYHVTDTKDSSITGYIYAGKGYDASVADNSKQDLGGLVLTPSDAAATTDNSVKVVYRNVNDNNAQVGSTTWITSRNDTKAGQDVAVKGTANATADDVNAAGTSLANYITDQVPAGYALTGTVNTAGVYGNTTYVDVTAAATSQVQFTLGTVDTSAAANATKVTPKLPVIGNVVSGSELNVSNFDSKVLAGAANTAITTSDADFANTIKALGGATYVGTTQYNDGTNSYHFEYTFDGTKFATTNKDAIYGQVLQGVLNAKLVKNTSTNVTTTTNPSWVK
ncbi:S-layer protein [Levilactobacillus wangkuiensis]|uniref:S-layer protein n=1 Tax=Levilactobacillus wangkuiensis TaxID=2799566 RepID=UPI0019523C64|nr:S-layer protein [Levilactobacillus wangkuiensis]